MLMCTNTIPIAKKDKVREVTRREYIKNTLSSFPSSSHDFYFIFYVFLNEIKNKKIKNFPFLNEAHIFLTKTF